MASQTTSSTSEAALTAVRETSEAALAAVRTNRCATRRLTNYECTIVFEDQSALSALGHFGSPLLQKLCSHQPFALQSAHGPVCFSRLILGATPGGWDMHVDRRVSQPVRFSSMVMGELVRMLFRTPPRVLPASGGVGSKVLFVQRKGTREMINYEVVYSRMVTDASPLGVRVVRANFDEMSLVEIIHHVSASCVAVGVHGAGLTNVIFFPLPAALVEVSIGNVKPEFFQLCQSLHVIHYDFTDVILVGKYDPDPRFMQVQFSQRVLCVCMSSPSTMPDAGKRQAQTSLFFDFTAKISSNGVLGSTIQTRQKGIPEFVESGAVGTLGSRS